MIPPVQMELTLEQQCNMRALQSILEKSDLNTPDGIAYILQMVKMQLIYRNNMTQLTKYIAENSI